MKTLVVEASKLDAAGRLDSWYFLSPAKPALEALGRAKRRGLEIPRLGGGKGLASRVHHPQRFKRALAAEREPFLPYLRPYDVFNYYPEAADYVSIGRTRKLRDYKLRAGQILQTRSGRNLGPAIIVDSYLASFVMSDDMIRIEVEDPRMRHYVLAYLNSQTGRRLLRRDKTGSVVDHLSENQVARQEIVVLDTATMGQIASQIEMATLLRESARLTIHRLVNDYEQALPPIFRSKPLRSGWTVRSIGLNGRLDAAYYDPLVTTVRPKLFEGGGRLVSDVADVFKPGSRFKTCYVEHSHGRPFLSGSQLLQTSLINLQFMSPRVFKSIADYELRTGWIAYPADGRAEEELGTPVLIGKDRDGWLASGHVGRIVPKPGVDVGWLFLALKTRHAQAQLKVRASGSVVDSTFPDDMLRVVLPPNLDVKGQTVLQAWEDLRNAQALEERAAAMIDTALGV